MNVHWSDFKGAELTGRNRRLLIEWQKIDQRISSATDISYTVSRRNPEGLPIEYLIEYRIYSISGVTHIDQLDEEGVENAPIYASRYFLKIEIPTNYPCIDAPAIFRFCTEDAEGKPIPHPWHPNIRYFGELAGRVCLNPTDCYTDIVWYVDRIASYLRYELYHAIQEPPYPEDLKVARWVTRQAEPKGWI